jgi:DNA-binding NarL/FixJ family response regulator
MARSTRPDSVVMDVDLPDVDGFTAGRIILGELPDTRILAITAIDHPDVVRDALRSGFHGCLWKHATMQEVVGALIASTHSQAVIPMQAATTIVADSGPQADGWESPALLKQLTPREREVLGLLAEGMSGRDIAEGLFLSRNTVRTHIQNILTKLQVHSRLQAAALATRHGILGASAGRTTRADENGEPSGTDRWRRERPGTPENGAGVSRARMERGVPADPPADMLDTLR